MNKAFLSGYLPTDAITRYAASGRCKWCFDLVVLDSSGAEARAKVEIEDESVARGLGPLLTSGRAVVIEAELAERPVKERDVVKFIHRYFRALRVEIPDRRRAAPEPEHAGAGVGDGEGEGEQ